MSAAEVAEYLTQGKSLSAANHRAAAAAFREVFFETGDILALAKAGEHDDAVARLEKPEVQQ